MSGVAIYIFCFTISAIVFALIGRKYFGTQRCQHKYTIDNMGRYKNISIDLFGGTSTADVHKFSAVCDKCGDHKVYYR